MALAIATLTVVSCEKKENKETTIEKKTQENKKEEAAKLAYVCPMDCEKGKIYDAAVKCPVCQMDLVNENLKKQTKAIEDEEHGHSHGEEGHGH